MDTPATSPELDHFLSSVLSPLLGKVSLGEPVASGYTLAKVQTGASVELTFTKGAGSFVVWLRSPADDTAFFKKSERFLVGYRGEPPDRQGFELLDALHKRILENEASLPDELYADFFTPRAG